MVLFAKNVCFFSLFRAALFVLFVISLLTPAIAGEYHASSGESPSGIATIACSQCHTMHGTQGNVSMIYSGGGSGVQTKLLRYSSVLGLCLYCHETGVVSAPDIKGTSVQGYIPSAGRFSDQNSDNYANMHDIALTAPTPPGNNNPAGWTNVTGKYGSTFNCLYCHDQHGNQNYRNLRYDPGNPVNDTAGGGVRVTYRMGAVGNCSDTSAAPCDVEQTVATGGGLDKYPRDTVTFRRAPQDADNPKRGVAAWCGKCHSQFYGISGDVSGYMGGTDGGNPGAGDTNAGTPWKRHPVQDIAVSAANSHTDTTNWAAAAASVRHVNPDGVAGNADEQPLCFSCHYAHGGGNPNNLTDPSLDHSILAYLDAADKVNIDATYSPATGRMRNVCQKCHNQ